MSNEFLYSSIKTKALWNDFKVCDKPYIVTFEMLLIGCFSPKKASNESACCVFPAPFGPK